MTEHEAIERCELMIGEMSVDHAVHKGFCINGTGYASFKGMVELMSTCKNALEEIHLYHESKLSLVPSYVFENICEENDAYKAIGTLEECRAAVDKQKAKRPIRNDLCTCPSCGTHNDVIKKRRNTVQSDIVYCWHCGQALFIQQ